MSENRQAEIFLKFIESVVQGGLLAKGYDLDGKLVGGDHDVVVRHARGLPFAVEFKVGHGRPRSRKDVGRKIGGKGDMPIYSVWIDSDTRTVTIAPELRNILADTLETFDVRTRM